MSKKIIVAGAGHGGIVAAYYLAQNGFDVTVYEKCEAGELGYEQSDSVHLDGFELAGIPVPEEYVTPKTPITFCVPGTDIEPLSQLEAADSLTVEIDRKVLYGHLIGLAAEAGAKFVYGCTIYEPIVYGSRVVGIKTSLGDIYADMVIDAAGLYSPVRMNLPDFMHITKEPGAFNVLTTYRAYFEKKPDAPEAEHKYKVSLIPGEFCGLLWVITKEDYTDIFIGAFNGLDDETVERYLCLLREENPQIGERLIKGGKYADIPVRAPLALLVADGYAAVGDSAFMTIPVKGSGVGYAMRAGKILAETISEDEDGLYDREHLWSYQTGFFDEIGESAGMLAVIKSLFPLLTLEDLEYALGQQIITSEELTMFGSETGVMKIVTSLKMAALRDKAKKLVNFPNLRKLLTFVTGGMTRYKMLQSRMRSKYDAAAAARWADSFDAFFAELAEPKKSKAEKENEEAAETAAEVAETTADENP